MNITHGKHCQGESRGDIKKISKYFSSMERYVPYPYTHEPWPTFKTDKEKGEEVTVGIGVLAEAGEVVILASDTRATFPGSNVGPHNECGKQWHLLPFRCAACAAGLLSIAQPTVDEVSRQFVNLFRATRRGPVFTRHIANAINKARFIVFQEMADWAMKRKYCLSLRQWQQGKRQRGKLGPLIVRAGESLILEEATQFRVELIVGGFLGNHQLVFYKASGMRHLESSTAPGVYVIGTGGQAAMDHLNSRGQNVECSLARSLLHVTEAAYIARKKCRKTVGEPSHFVVIWKDGTMKRFDPQCPVMRSWLKLYRNRRTTLGLDRSPTAHVEVESQMIEHDQ